LGHGVARGDHFGDRWRGPQPGQCLSPPCERYNRISPATTGFVVQSDIIRITLDIVNFIRATFGLFSRAIPPHGCARAQTWCLPCAWAPLYHNERWRKGPAPAASVYPPLPHTKWSGLRQGQKWSTSILSRMRSTAAGDTLLTPREVWFHHRYPI
jgi:hypothetical protein